jgi:hypothetical protein
MFDRARALARGERGQSLVELTLGFTMLLILMSGLLDLGRAYFIYVALEDGAGEAALYLSINPQCWDVGSGPGCGDPNNALYRARNAGGAFVDWQSAVISVNPASYSDRDTIGDTVTVSIAYSFQLLTPVIPEIAGANPITLTGEASQMIIRSE